MEQNHCGHLGFSIDTNLSRFDPKVFLLLQSKFRLKATEGFERDVIKWRLSYIIINPLSFSYFVSTRRPCARHQVSIQLDYRGHVRNMNSQHFSHINV